ncbi:hypothetical protein P3339_00920 [Microbulbifer sp. MLAF003]|uniref:hypothetical protein n=1 Tax=Microbulbifer sp. MLAF003 TaxID=3032582 RepID=UPI0024AE501E|nr:hypothetical protein [Microbulbifer sp. MLAF003]WHI51430.1 hypothetical protein P3339_00920 [Microbulbifer sp. MLAF003]
MNRAVKSVIIAATVCVGLTLGACTTGGYGGYYSGGNRLYLLLRIPLRHPQLLPFK